MFPQRFLVLIRNLEPNKKSSLQFFYLKSWKGRTRESTYASRIPYRVLNSSPETAPSLHHIEPLSNFHATILFPVHRGIADKVN